MARRQSSAALTAAVRAFDRAAGPQPIRLLINDDGPGDTRGFDRLFVGLGATLDAFPSVLRDAIPVVRAAHADVFATEGAAGRGAWRKLAPRTLDDRRRKGFPPGPILVRTGALRAHVLNAPATITQGAGVVTLRIAPKPNARGVPKYRALARGGPNLPARPMVAIGPRQATKVTSAISRALRQRAAANGL